MTRPHLSDDPSDFFLPSSVGAATLLPPPSSTSILEPPARPRPAPALSVSRRTSTSITPARLPRTSSLLPPPRVVAAAAAASTSYPPSDASIYNLTRPGRPLSPSEQSDSSGSARVPLLSLPPILPLSPLDEGSDGRPSSLEVLPGGDASDRDTSGPSPDPTRPVTAGSHTRMPYEQARDAYPPRDHAKSRNGKGSVDLTKARGAKPPSQKAMLSRALQKANTAVQLDNAQNFEGARLAYGEACGLLQQVLSKTSGSDDKRKLEAIRRTYSSRIDELDQMGPWQGDGNKALPARPESLEYPQSAKGEGKVGEDQVSVIGTANTMTDARDDSRSPLPLQLDASPQQRRGGRQTSRSGSRESLRPASSAQHPPLHSAFSRSPARVRDDAPRRPSESTQMPPPLSTFRSMSPPKAQLDAAEDAERPFTSSSWGESREAAGHLRDGSQNSWLDPIDESGGSSASSVHSRTSSLGFRRKHIRGASGNTENEFDTALDAAIEAAYDEGYEPMGSEPLDPEDASDEIVNKVLRKVEMARERVRQTEREVYNGERQRQQSLQRRQYESQDTSEDFYDDNSSDEEERMLEEMTRGYGIEDFTMTEERKLSMTRPVSRGPTTGTWQSPIEPGSATETKPPAVANDKAVPRGNVSKSLQPSAPPPTHSLPELPGPRPSSPQSVRNRRLSGQNPKQLKIETSKLRPSPPTPYEEASKSQSRSTSAAAREMDVPAGDAARLAATKRRESPPNEPMFIGSPPSSRGQADGDESSMRRSGSPSANKLRKNFSSSSLRSMKNRNMSLSNLDDGSDMSPSTPSSNNHFGRGTPAMPALPTPLAAAFREHVDGSAGLHLFEDNFHMPNSPGSPNPTSLDAPVSLEPCPNDFMLRPFWLMRCLYQTLVHPRGGYLSTKLFVPREVWKVKGVRLKNIEDKMANCDYLTAALSKLAKVDTCDADAVLEEMQSLEGVLEQVQATLARKLGNEVGVQSSGVLFKEASSAMDGDGASMPRTASVSGKSSSFSWRRLRSKNSAMGLGGAYNSKLGSTEGVKEIVTLSTLPMTPQPTSRPAKRDVALAQFAGPNAQYMGSLARLFDAAQAIDQIARQVDDPGLRHADKTQVGLELCTRHAAEFFGFYICRFVLADLSMLLDKFIKRGSEWVLA